MKNRILLGLIIFFLSVNIWSMVELGVSGGINISCFHEAGIHTPYSGRQTADYIFGLHVYPFSLMEEESSNQKVFFRTGMYFLRQSTGYHIQPETSNSIKLQSSLSYLRFPAVLEYALINRSTFREKIYAGGYMAFNLKVRALYYRVLDLENILTIKVPEDHELFSSIETKRDSVEVGLTFGLRTELKLENGTMVFDIGYSRSLDNIKNPLLPFNRHRNECMMFLVGYKFN